MFIPNQNEMSASYFFLLQSSSSELNGHTTHPSAKTKILGDTFVSSTSSLYLLSFSMFYLFYHQKKTLNLSFPHLYYYQLSPSHHILPVPHYHYLYIFLLRKIHFFLHTSRGNHFKNANEIVSHLYLKTSCGFLCSHGAIPVLSPGPA